MSPCRFVANAAVHIEQRDSRTAVEQLRTTFRRYAIFHLSNNRSHYIDRRRVDIPLFGDIGNNRMVLRMYPQRKFRYGQSVEHDSGVSSSIPKIHLLQHMFSQYILPDDFPKQTIQQSVGQKIERVTRIYAQIQ